MLKRWLRFSMVLLTMAIAIAAAFIMAKTPTGLNTTNEPADSWLSMVKLISLFIPALILSFFHNSTVRIISAIYQGFFIFLLFLMVILIGVIAPDNGYWIRVMGIIGAFVSISSIVLTMVMKEKQGKRE